MKNLKNYPNSLRFYRKKAGLTLEQLAQITGLAVSSIGNVETGAREPGEKFLQKICKTLQIPPHELLRAPGDSIQSIGSRDFLGEETAPGRRKITKTAGPAFTAVVRETDESPVYGTKANQRGTRDQSPAERIRLATKLRSDARELRNIAARMEEEAEMLEQE